MELIYSKRRPLSTMESMLAAALIGFPAVDTDDEELEAPCTPFRTGPAATVFDFDFACPVIADPPTDRAVPAFRDLLSCLCHDLLASLVSTVLFRNRGPYRKISEQTEHDARS